MKIIIIMVNNLFALQSKKTAVISPDIIVLHQILCYHLASENIPDTSKKPYYD